MTWLLYVPLGALGVVLILLGTHFWPLRLLHDDPDFHRALACLVAGCVFLFIAGRWSV